MFKRISIHDAKLMLDKGDAQFVDIRDEQSFIAGHIPHAEFIDQSKLPAYIESADLTKPLLVCCYHGNSSQSAAEFFNAKGFADVYSIDGGFEAWKMKYDCESGSAS